MVDDVHDRIHRRRLEHAEPIPREESVAQLLAAQGSATIRQQQFSRRTPVPVHLGSGENPVRRAPRSVDIGCSASLSSSTTMRS